MRCEGVITASLSSMGPTRLELLEPKLFPYTSDDMLMRHSIMKGRLAIMKNTYSKPTGDLSMLKIIAIMVSRLAH